MSTKKTTVKAKKPAVKKEEVLNKPQVSEPTPEPVLLDDVIGSLK